MKSSRRLTFTITPRASARSNCSERSAPASGRQILGTLHSWLPPQGPSKAHFLKRLFPSAAVSLPHPKFATLARMASPGKSGRSDASAPTAASGILTSRDNRWLKGFRMALRGGLPTESGSVGVEGVRLVEEALRSGCRIEAVLFSESGERHHERLAPFIGRPEMAFPCLRTTDRLFLGLADTEHPQGVAALVHPRLATFDELLHAASACAPLLVVLAGVQDPGNVGTILRTAAAFGATGAVTAASGQSGTASPFSPKALRASAGAALHLPILPGVSLPILLTQLK